MARYYFHLFECGTLIPDEEGQEIADPRLVHARAVREARELMAAEVAKGELCLSCRIEVTDQNQRPVLVLPFREALRLTGL